MEFRLAAEGNTDELRQWLRAHPERVNVPAQGSNMTLLYTTISNANRTDLASLQAGNSRYLNTVRMLCEEYKADVLAPNGGNYNTALHLAASVGQTEIVRYLVDVLHTPIDRANVFGERPVQMAERGGFAECVGILQRAAAQRDRVATNAAAAPTALVAASAGANSGDAASRFQSMMVSDSDDDDHDAEQHGHLHGGSNNDHRPCQLHRANSTGVGSQPQSDGIVVPRSAPLGPLPHSSNPQMGHALLPPTKVPTSRVSAAGDGGSFGGNSKEPKIPKRVPKLGSFGSRCGESTSSVGAAAETPSAPLLPQPVRPRKEYDISRSRILANPDLQGFRSAYGDGFKYIQCRDHYEIRGILPYTYRGTVYYTPVIISVYAPGAANDSLSTPTGTNAASADCGRETPGSASDLNAPPGAPGASQKSSVPDDSTGGPAEVYCRYRVCLNMQSLNDFAVSRKAEYIDPISGAIIPAPGDDKYQTLTAYIRNVVVRSFECVPPLITPTSNYAFPVRPNVSQLGAADNADPYRHHHSHNAPAFMRNALPSRTAAHVRCATILRDLSRFGDGLGRYFPAHHRLVVYVPVFSEHKAAVLAVPQDRPYTTTVDQYSMPASPGGGANDLRSLAYPSGMHADDHKNATSSSTHSSGRGPKKAVTQQVAVEAVAELQVRVWIQFHPTTGTGAATADAAAVDGQEVGGGIYAYPPRIYLVDAAANLPVELRGSSLPTPNTLTGPCFASLLRDRDTGEVEPATIRLSQESWSAQGSVYDILVELQRVLRDAVESFAIRYAGRQPAAAPAQHSDATADVHGRGGGGGASGAPANTERSPAASPLDTFFTSPTTQSPQPMSGQSGSQSSTAATAVASSKDAAGRCLYCYQKLQTRSLLQPCGHDGLCGLCVQRLQSHCREEVFACPVCRSAVRNVMDVFL
ncbi:hypothetical protein ABB37_08864 [Leptomonas pyrrhocoris]|uniref:RING-type domain-containing protein n=1 Tax=Leptomonas pyrrhocoris TaxID=157538 RepID=A0A0M9FS32_LEPPY|nr:hypothetical protein ABB37_08864 [Leptomonas pyrrhocoris]XP_015653286.1 hypothetical protein ABB37_08864 [Leptomonas pyrrhocoris]KPA74846.1 hypothetical protein ABB37_08864 [Leptomonas pyrrhocoris]KPA74847.1 hypothetical protein ABB37_08864 [Leptomonas pyrrhocoris]|eukprot:XP_015653285.1 hypothetical protein ABB37_08864 [Leptomonas pyrrhocoris]